MLEILTIAAISAGNIGGWITADTRIPNVAIRCSTDAYKHAWRN